MGRTNDISGEIVNYTEELSRFIVRLSFEDLPSNVVDLSKKSLLDWVGVTVGAANAPAVQILMDVLDLKGTEKQSSIVGRNVKDYNDVCGAH